MGAVTAARSTEPRLTRADLDAMPDDGRRHELLGGSIIVSPSPGFAHQSVVTSMFRLLDAAVPADLRLLPAPFDVALPSGDVVVPDLLVARLSDFTSRDLPAPPVLVVEVLSPSTRRRDLGEKLAAYRDAGVPHYWVVDPDGPHLLAHRLVDGDYPRTDVGPDDTWATDQPFPVSVTPRDLG
ncbi:MAG: hypothetical protein CMH83_12490 [Nocardioides sp.]|nr:hypothetical protein [Nocardioides sp.]